jgi:hypothetical protein
LRDVDPEQLSRGRGRTGRPQRLHEEIGGDDLVGPDEQCGEERPVLGRADRRGDAARYELERSEDAELDGGLGRD